MLEKQTNTLKEIFINKIEITIHLALLNYVRQNKLRSQPETFTVLFMVVKINSSILLCIQCCWYIF
jgi:hypothetical protein